MIPGPARTTPSTFRFEGNAEVLHTVPAHAAVHTRAAELEDLLRQLYAGDRFDLEPVGGPRELFGVQVKTDSKASLGDLLARLG